MTDFDDFWAGTLAAPKKLDATFAPAWMKAIEVFDVTFNGFDGEPVQAWLALPRGTTAPLPCVVEFPGYSKGRGLAHESLLYAAAGYAHLMMDVRDQSGRKAGFMTLGMLDPETYYYRRVIADAVRAVEAARSHPLVDSSRVAVAGESQGGGLALAVAALVPDVIAVAADVPFLCDFRRGAELATAGPYPEIAQYLALHRDHLDRVFETLNYFDAVNFAERAQCPALFSVALMDLSCPPATVYSAFHAYAGPRRIEVYPFNGHEGGEAFHAGVRLRFLADAFGE
ncbi:MAG TPA: acetylxylan esterase [Micromonosporaceae bacterium]|nr:acetylxylan esterase [Micromonosporaceae bacterium]HCU48761.1 acetylxylan esterase [Micromonosporaceae bacterium]